MQALWPVINCRCRYRPNRNVAADAKSRDTESASSSVDSATNAVLRFKTALRRSPAAVRVQDSAVRSGCSPGSAGMRAERGTNHFQWENATISPASTALAMNTSVASTARARECGSGRLCLIACSFTAQRW